MFRIIALLGAAAFLSGCMTPRRAPIPDATPATDKDVAAALAYVARGRLAHDVDGDREMAADLFEAAARTLPHRLGLTVMAGNARLESQATNAALALVEWALPYHKDSAEGNYELGRLAWNSGDSDLARKLFSQAIRLDPEDARAHSGLAFLELQAGDHSAAHGLFETALTLAPDDSLPYIGLAMSALQESNHELALRIAADAVDHGLDDPRLARFFRDFALILIAQDELEKALLCIKALQMLAPEELDSHHLAAMVNARLGRHDEASQALFNWPSAEVQPEIVNDLLADIYESLNDYERALNYAMTAVAGDDAPLSAWLRTGRLLLMAGEAHRAAGLMAQAADRFPSDETIWLFRGLAYSAAERYDEAVKALKKSASLAATVGAPLPPMFDFWIGAAYERNEQYDDAERHFRRSIDNHPNIHEAYNYLAYMWAERGTNLTEALELIEVALAAEPDNGAYIDTHGWIYYQQGQYEKALEELKRAQSLKPDNPVINEHVGDALAALDRGDEAAHYWKLSLEHDPDNADVRRKLGQIANDPNQVQTDQAP